MTEKIGMDRHINTNSKIYQNMLREFKLSKTVNYVVVFMTTNSLNFVIKNLKNSLLYCATKQKS